MSFSVYFSLQNGYILKSTTLGYVENVTQFGVNESGSNFSTVVFTISPFGLHKYTSILKPNSASTCKIAEYVVL